MGGTLFGKAAKTPIASTLRVQTAVQGRPLAIGAGQNRLSGNMVWYGDFQYKKGTAGGKGGVIGYAFGKGNGEDYSSSAVISLGEGPIANITSIYNGNNVDFLIPPSAQVLADLMELGIVPTYGNGTYNGTYIQGEYGQAPWSYLVANHADQALAYGGEPLACFANLNLGNSPVFPVFNFEVIWGLNAGPGSPTTDTNPAYWISAFLTNPDWGVPGFPAALLGDLTDFTAYCAAYNLWISPVLTDQTSAQSHLADIMQATASDFVWSQGLLTPRPYADQAASANGFAFTPATTPVYALTTLDFLPNQGSLGQGAVPERGGVQVSRPNPTTAVNSLSLEYLDRSNLYNPTTIWQRDEAIIALTDRQRVGTLRSHHFICYGPTAAVSVALQLAREKVLAQFQFTLPSQFILLEAMDVVTLTCAPVLPVPVAVRIIEIQENSDQSLTFTAEEVLGSVGPASSQLQQSLGTAVNANALADPVNPPIIFEPPLALAGDAEIWVAVSGGEDGVADPNWGGCNIWVSLDGNTYEQVGSLNAACRQGVTAAPLAAFAGTNPDITDTLLVNLAESDGELGPATDQNGQTAATLSIVDNELFAYGDVALVSGSTYAITDLYRGLYGTAAPSHASGAPFARLDGAIFKYQLAPQYAGLEIFLKFQSFNIYGAGIEDLGDCVAYSFVTQGTALDHPVARAMQVGAPLDFGFVNETPGLIDDFGTPILSVELDIDLGTAAGTPPTTHPVALLMQAGGPLDFGTVTESVGTADDFGTPFETIAYEEDLGVA